MIQVLFLLLVKKYAIMETKMNRTREVPGIQDVAN